MLPSLEERRDMGDMISTYKILRGNYNVYNIELFKSWTNRTRDHGWKLETKRSYRGEGIIRGKRQAIMTI